MAFIWRNYLHTSEVLMNDELSKDEAHLRSSVSRAYYAVFGTIYVFIKNHYSANYNSVLGKDSHNSLITFLKDSDDSELFELGHRLGALKSRRKDADYVSTVNINVSYARDTNSKAIEALELFDKIVDDPPII